ncbi:hypothetical protein J2W91_004213 [Paenibacillus amylolyticus]|uniref:Uncharacterized protein n=1 Tax=Paenibacillus amylolyticus TaxID=1451 RepID=A0AAP5H637_PAEAM|nr:hypothetical protein [Paenibacillus amylolyticus]
MGSGEVRTGVSRGDGASPLSSFDSFEPRGHCFWMYLR